MSRTILVKRGALEAAIRNMEANSRNRTNAEEHEDRAVMGPLMETVKFLNDSVRDRVTYEMP